MSADHVAAPTAPPSSGSAATCACATRRRSSPPPRPPGAGSRCSCWTRPCSVRRGRRGGPSSTAACGRSTRASADGCSSSGRPGRRRATDRRRGRRAAGARRGRLRPVRAHPGRGRREGARRRRPRARTHGLALRRRARPGHQARRDPVPGVHPVQPGLAAPRLARSRRHRRRHRRVDRPRRQARRPAPGQGSRTTTGRRATCRRPARTPRSRAGGSSSTTASAGYKRTRDRPDKPGTSRMSVHLKYGAVHPRTLLADLAGPLRRGRRHPAHRARLARLLRRRPVAPPRDGPRELRPPLRRAAAGTAARRPTPTSRRGRRAAPASRSSTPGCASCARRPGCTTGSA